MFPTSLLAHIKQKEENIKKELSSQEEDAGNYKKPSSNKQGHRKMETEILLQNPKKSNLPLKPVRKHILNPRK